MNFIGPQELLYMVPMILAALAGPALIVFVIVSLVRGRRQ